MKILLSTRYARRAPRAGKGSAEKWPLDPPKARRVVHRISRFSIFTGPRRQKKVGFRARPAGPPARPPASQPSGRRPGQLPASPGASHSNPPKSNQRQGNPTKSNEIQVNPEKSNQIHGFLLKSWILIEIADIRQNHGFLLKP